MAQLVSKLDFYTEQSVLHPLVVGIPITLAVWLYLRVAPNRILTNLTKFDWIVSVTLGSTLSRVITGSSTTLDLTRGALSLAILILFQLLLAYCTILLPRFIPLLRSEPQIVIFRGQMQCHGMLHGALLLQDIRIGMRRANVVAVEEIEAMVLEASGGFTVVTRGMCRAAGVESGEVPGCLKGVRQYEMLHAQAKAKIEKWGSAVEGAGGLETV